MLQISDSKKKCEARGELWVTISYQVEERMSISSRFLSAKWLETFGWSKGTVTESSSYIDE